MTESTTPKEYTDMGEDDRGEACEPVEKRVVCPSCGADAFAVVPQGTEVVDDNEASDGKVWVNCLDCENRFIAHYQNEE